MVILLVRPSVRALEYKLKRRFKGRRRFDFGTIEVNYNKVCIYLNREMLKKIVNYFIPTYTQSSSCQHILLTIWFKSSMFFSFLFHSGLSLVIFFSFLNFSFLFAVLWSKYMWLARFNEWAKLREAVMIGSLEFHGWNPPVWTIFNLHKVHAS